MRRATTFGAAVAFVLGLCAPALAAQPPGNTVGVTPDSPSGKEYQLPTAAGGGGSHSGKGGSSGGSGSSSQSGSSGSSSGSSGSSSGSGSGIGAGTTQSSGSSGHHHRKHDPAATTSPTTATPPPGESAIRAKQRAAAGADSGGGGGFPWLPVLIGVAVLAAGLGGGLWMRRRLTGGAGQASPSA
jgi:cobalamin biosynthesis Mg chelatase CobN